jgi:hypothetical protein
VKIDEEFALIKLFEEVGGNLRKQFWYTEKNAGQRNLCPRMCPKRNYRRSLPTSLAWRY